MYICILCYVSCNVLRLVLKGTEQEDLKLPVFLGTDSRFVFGIVTGDSLQLFG